MRQAADLQCEVRDLYFSATQSDNLGRFSNMISINFADIFCRCCNQNIRAAKPQDVLRQIATLQYLIHRNTLRYITKDCIIVREIRCNRSSIMALHEI